MKLILIAAIASISACIAVRERPSAMVRRAAACGAGDVTTASGADIHDWFSKHAACAVEVDTMCNPVRQNARAQWTDSTEGRICQAARNVAQWIRKPLDDHATFEAGWK